MIHGQYKSLQSDYRVLALLYAFGGSGLRVTGLMLHLLRTFKLISCGFC